VKDEIFQNEKQLFVSYKKKKNNLSITKIEMYMSQLPEYAVKKNL